MIGNVGHSAPELLIRISERSSSSSIKKLFVPDRTSAKASGKDRLFSLLFGRHRVWRDRSGRTSFPNYDDEVKGWAHSEGRYQDSRGPEESSLGSGETRN